VLKFFGDGQAAAAFDRAVRALADVPGIEQLALDPEPFAAVAYLLYHGPWVAERRAALGAFFDTHAAAIDPAVQEIIAAADHIDAAAAFRGAHRLAELRRGCDAAMSRCDALLVPTAPTIYRLAEVAADPLGTNSRLGTYTNFVNLLGYAALALPGPFRDDGLPAGVTLIGPAGSDHRLAELARRFEPLLHQRLGTTTRVPPYALDPLPPLPCGEATVDVAVVGAHLAGLPLNWQLTTRCAEFVETTRSAAAYRLYALPGTVPPKPGLLRVREGGAAIEVEVWRMPERLFGAFVAEIPPPLCIGSLELADGRQVKSFLAESAALADARDISEFGGWRAFLAAQAGTS
jgi:allophanate hydrolase